MQDKLKLLRTNVFFMILSSFQGKPASELWPAQMSCPMCLYYRLRPGREADNRNLKCGTTWDNALILKILRM